MDAATRKSFEIQAQVRHNAESYGNELKDLYVWQKEAKAQDEKLLQGSAEIADNEQVASEELSIMQKKQQLAKTKKKLEKDEEHEKQKLKQPKVPKVVAEQLKHKQANEIKDKGNEFVKQSEFSKAIEQYNMAIELYSKDAIYYTNRALCHLRLEKFEECIRDCEFALELDKTTLKAYYRRMQANESLGNYLDALKDCATILVIDCKNSDARKSRERINNRIRQNANAAQGAKFTPLRPNFRYITPIDKPAHKRSTKPMHRVPIAEIEGPNENKNQICQLSDEDIDHLFNSNCGPIVEIKKPTSAVAVTKVVPKNEPAIGVEKKSKVQSVNIAETTENVISQRASNSCASSTAASVTGIENVDSKSVNEKLTLSVTADKPNTANINNDAVELPNNNNITVTRTLPAAPTSAAQFHSNWKELIPEQKYQYLKSINISDLNKVLGAGFDSDTLTEIVHTLLNFYVPQKEAELSKILLELSKHEQMGILSLLMSDEDSKAISKILAYLKEQNIEEKILQTLTKNFNLN